MSHAFILEEGKNQHSTVKASKLFSLAILYMLLLFSKETCFGKRKCECVEVN